MNKLIGSVVLIIFSGLCFFLSYFFITENDNKPKPEIVVNVTPTTISLTWYTSIPQKHANRIGNAFKIETGININIVRSSTFIIRERLMSEIENSATEADVVTIADIGTYQELKNQGCLMKYDSPHYKAFPEEYKDTNYWTVFAGFGICMAYNESRVDAPPQHWTDLLNKRWRGRIGLEDINTAGSQYGQYYMLREKLGVEFWKELLSVQEPRIYDSSLIDEISGMENRLRKRDILISDEDIFVFYQKRLEGIYDIRTLKHNLKKRGSDKFLRMKKDDLLRYFPDEEKLSLFPDDITLGIHRFKCNYSFEPGSRDDGVTIKVPSALAATVPAESVDWLVPGLYRDKITALIKGLPKDYRKQLVPVINTVDIIANEMPEANISLITVLGQFIYKRFGVDIPASAWSEDLLPDHLKMRIAITGAKGEVICSGRNKTILSQSISDRTDQDKSNEFESAKKEREIIDIKRWDFGDLSDTISITGKHGTKWVVCPGLELEKKDNKKSISLRFFQKRDKAIRSHEKGVAALFAMHFSKELKFLKKSLILSEEKKNMSDYFGGARIFKQRMYESLIKSLFCRNIRTKDAFYLHATCVEPDILKKGHELLSKIIPVLEACHETRSIISNLENANKSGSKFVQFSNNLRNELFRLVPETFMDLYDNERLSHIARYIRTIGIRAQRASVNFEKDEVKAKKLKIYINGLNEMLKKLSSTVSEEKKQALEEYFWLIEEYKVSLFAQELKTAFPVSEKKLDKKLKEIERMV